jgi:hypothetical protein
MKRKNQYGYIEGISENEYTGNLYNILMSVNKLIEATDDEAISEDLWSIWEKVYHIIEDRKNEKA